MAPINAVGIQVSRNFNFADFVDIKVPAVTAIVGVQSYAQPHFHDGGANINFGFLNASRDHPAEDVGKWKPVSIEIHRTSATATGNTCNWLPEQDSNLRPFD